MALDKAHAQVYRNVIRQ